MVTKNTLREQRIFAKTMKEARIGTVEAQYELALMYANGVGVGIDIAKAIHWLQQAATRGLASAQLLLATRYLSGVGVDRDEPTALLWLAKAAAQGNVKAILRLGRYLETPHRDAALTCLHHAAMSGLADAQWACAQAILKDDPTEEQVTQAVGYLISAAGQGVSAAQNALGNLYLQGVGVTGDTELALEWYRKAAAQGSVQAMVTLERVQLVGKVRGTDPRGSRRHRRPNERRSAHQKWLDAAEQGDADTRYHLGMLLEMGWGVDQNPEQAQHWYRTAAMQGDARAQLALARMLEAGSSIESFDWYRKSAQQGVAEAQFALARNLSSGVLLPQDGLQGLAWYLRAAEQGHAAALVTVGSLVASDMGNIAMGCYERAAILGVAQAQFQVGEALLCETDDSDKMQKAMHWLVLAARQGHAPAQCSIGLMYLEGRGVSRDRQAGVDWLIKAAEQGEAKAQWNLGSLYAKDLGSNARDVKRAMHWCRLAADQGFAAAQATLGALYARMERWTEAQYWLERAVAQDDPEALFNLAMLTFQSRMQSISPEQALTYLWRSADKGVVAAQSRLGIAFAKGEGAALDPIEAHKWFLIASRHGDSAAEANRLRSERLLAEIPLREAKRRAEVWFQILKV